MNKLIDRLKPELRLKLEKNRDQWKFSVDEIFDLLEKNYFYSDLTIAEVSRLQIFSEVSINEMSAMDLKYGDCFFDEYKD
jgi:hypothetical protein